jgi:hypothetical protein
MAAELVNSSKSEKTIGTLEDGQIAIVIDHRHCGEVVQRYGDNCIVIGKGYGQGWSSCNNNSIKVRVLEDGETIKVFNNSDEKSIY